MPSAIQKQNEVSKRKQKVVKGERLHEVTKEQTKIALEGLNHNYSCLHGILLIEDIYMVVNFKFYCYSIL